VGGLDLVLLCVGSYLIIGLPLGAWYLVRVAPRVDPGVSHSTWGFRLVAMPGAAALWPYLLLRSARRGGGS